ncbi:poly(ethylene terephthalate) hydrolase family protein [Corynebacterium gerontici]|uniref:Alpha/beta hydrolase family protein n=1 Tax=Corynebacterium gerontici TaxID=2079234 RepID=A0A3G6J659_9CORY|nr:alpha/beta hydrolase [Corynebacterium gerontici]AZA11940.1 Alpha/beta hydrolase family protein [Corynebacterium gerontici]
MIPSRTKRIATAALATALISTATPATQAHALGITDGLIPIADALQTIPQPAEDIAPKVPQPLADMGLTGTRITAPFHSDPGAIRTEFGAPGTHPVASSLPTIDCTPIYALYNQILRFNHGNNVPPECYGVTPEGPNPAIGYQFIYPTDLEAGQRAPLIVLSPGIGAEPGMVHHHAEFYASHGYVVALGYSVANWFGAQMDIAALAANQTDLDPASPLYQRVDFSKILLVGHSAGGGAAIREAGLLDKLLQSVGREDARIEGTVGINPGPADFGVASPPSPVPTLVLAAEHESLVPWPLSKLAYDRATGPKWWAVVRGAEHGVYLDASELTVYDSLVISFADYTLRGSEQAARVYQGQDMLLKTDSELMNVTTS